MIFWPFERQRVRTRRFLSSHHGTLLGIDPSNTERLTELFVSSYACRHDQVCIDPGHYKHPRLARYPTIWPTDSCCRSPVAVWDEGTPGERALKLLAPRCTALISLQWESTQDNLKLTLERNVFGMGLPMRKLMERKLVTSVRIPWLYYSSL